MRIPLGAGGGAVLVVATLREGGGVDLAGGGDERLGAGALLRLQLMK